MSTVASTIAGLFANGPVGVLLKVTGVLCCAAVCAFALRGASAAVRHLVWLTGLVSCIGLAVLSPAVPRFDVRLPARSEPVVVAVPAAPRTSTRHVIDRPIVAATSMLAAPRATSARKYDEPRVSSATIELLVAGTWLIGFVLVLARCGVGHRRIARMIERAGRLDSQGWIGALDAAALDVGLSRDVALLVSEDLSAPVTAGFLRPVVILPLEALEWDAERLHIVLVHELAHVVRFDYLTQLFATLACALLWFHPVAWLAAARLRAEAEHAADDYVLDSGTSGVTYATHLLALARGDVSSQLSPAVAVGMIRSTRLEGRFRAMLDSTRSRAAVSSRFQAIAASLALCAMVPLAGMRPVVARRPIPMVVAKRVVDAATVAASHGATPAVAMAVATPVTAAAAIPTPSAIPAGAATPVPAPGVIAVADSSFEKTIDAAAGEQLTLDLRTGGSIALHGWDEPRIRLVARLAGRDWQETRVTLERMSNGVRLRSEFAGSAENTMTSHQFELWVPKHVNVSVSSAGGALAINDLSGDFYGHTGGGGITIEGATGRATLSTGGGAVTVLNSTLSGSVTTGGGEVTISNVTGGLRGSSASGSVTASGGGFGPSTVTRPDRIGATSIDGASTSGGFGSSGRRTNVTSTTTSGSGSTVTTNFPDGLAYTTTRGEITGRGYGGSLSISKDGGNIILDEAPAGAVLYTGGGRIVVGSSSRSVTATTGGGDIELEHVAGDAFASTGSGDVRISVVNVSGSAHTIDVISGKGRVVLELPADLDAQVELESAYTNNVGRRTSIESDFPLTPSETNEWDNRVGTPRKYVRAVGTFGRGTGRIRVRTVNGDIVVKRVNR